MSESKPVSALANFSTKLATVGSLTYLSTRTRSDIDFTVGSAKGLPVQQYQKVLGLSLFLGQFYLCQTLFS